MSIKVIGAGFGRTGTMSMKLALERLGLGRCHHMEEVIENPWQLPHWHSYVNGTTPDWPMLLNGYSCTVDWPSAHFWHQLYKAHPGSKVVLTTRPTEDWWASYSKTIMEFMTLTLAPEAPDIPRAVTEMCVDIIAKQTFGSEYTDKTAGMAAFEQRTADVKAAIPAADLLIYQVGSGWDALCEFLGLPVPDEPFPKSNSRSEFWENFGPDA